MNLTINKTQMIEIEAMPRLSLDNEDTTFTSPPTDADLAQFVESVRDSADEAYQAKILTSPGVAEGFDEANALIERLRDAL